MSYFTDKAQDKADELAGKAEDVAGDLADDTSLPAEGKVDQATAKTQQAGGLRRAPRQTAKLLPA